MTTQRTRWMMKIAMAMVIVVGMIGVVGCATVERTTDALVDRGWFYYDRSAYLPLGYRDYRDVVGYHMWLQDRTSPARGPWWNPKSSDRFDGACYRCQSGDR